MQDLKLKEQDKAFQVRAIQGKGSTSSMTTSAIRRFDLHTVDSRNSDPALLCHLCIARTALLKHLESRSIGLLRNMEHSRHVQHTRHDLDVMISFKLTIELALQEVLQAERQQFAQERDRLRNKLRGEELQIEARKLKDELIRLRRVRRWREESIVVQIVQLWPFPSPPNFLYIQDSAESSDGCKVIVLVLHPKKRLRAIRKKRFCRAVGKAYAKGCPASSLVDRGPALLVE